MSNLTELLEKDPFEAGYKAATDRACLWLSEHVDLPYEGTRDSDGYPTGKDYIKWLEDRLELVKPLIEEFKKFMVS